MADQSIQLEITMENGQLKVKAKESGEALGDVGKKGKNAFDMINTAAKAFMGLAVVKFFYDIGKAAITNAAAMEKNMAAFETLLGSAGAAKQMMSDLRDFGAKTPFELPGLVETSKKLLGFGVAQEDLISVMTRLGDASMGNQEKLDSLALAYGEVQAKGKASLEEINIFTEAGVPILEALAKQYNVSKEAMSDLISSGKVGFKDLDKAITSLTTGNGQFAGMMLKQSATLSGMWSNFQDGLTGIYTDLGGKLLPNLKLLTGGLLDSAEAGGILSSAFAVVGGALDIVVATLASAINYLNAMAYASKKTALDEMWVANQLAQEEAKRTGNNKELLRLQNEQKLIQKDTDALTTKLNGSLDATKQAWTNIGKQTDEATKKADAYRKKMAGKKDEPAAAKGESDAEKKSREEFEKRRALLDKYYDYEYTTKDQALLDDNARELQAAQYYEQVLRSKIGLDTRYAQGLATVTNTASVYMQQSNKGLFRFGQALSVAQTLQNTAQAIMKTWANLGFPYAIPGVAVVGGAGALQVAQIMKQKAPEPSATSVKIQTPALETGGFIRGTGNGTLITAGEKNKSEMILPLDDPIAMAKLRSAMGMGQQSLVVNVAGTVISENNLADAVTRIQNQQARDNGYKTTYRKSSR